VAQAQYRAERPGVADLAVGVDGVIATAGGVQRVAVGREGQADVRVRLRDHLLEEGRLGVRSADVVDEQELRRRGGVGGAVRLDQ
jgi:hypothetical protein